MAASDDIAQTLLPAVDQTRLGGETPPPAERQIDQTQFGGSAPSGAAGPGAADAAVTSSAAADTMQQTQFGAGLAAAQKDVADTQQLAATQLAGRGTAEGIDQTRLGGGGGVDQTQFGGGAPARELVGVGESPGRPVGQAQVCRSECELYKVPMHKMKMFEPVTLISRHHSPLVFQCISWRTGRSSPVTTHLRLSAASSRFSCRFWSSRTGRRTTRGKDTPTSSVPLLFNPSFDK